MYYLTLWPNPSKATMVIRGEGEITRAEASKFVKNKYNGRYTILTFQQVEDIHFEELKDDQGDKDCSETSS